VPNIRWLLRLITVCHRFLLRVSKGRLGTSIGGISMLLLENVGRKSGAKRITPLLFVEDSGRYVVVASNGGDDRNPAWWLNLQARPDAAVTVRGKRVEVKAHRAGPDETEVLWPRLEAAYKYYAEYRRRTDRDIPIVILEPTGDAAGSHT
jgi:deazaflavin-dependent oxidoreductase (nitroreductase family)